MEDHYIQGYRQDQLQNDADPWLDQLQNET
jgi:hypothetical protein